MYLASPLLRGLLSSLLFLAWAPAARAQYYGQADPITGRWLAGMSLGHAWVQGDIQPIVPGFQASLYGQRSLSRAFDVHLGLSLYQLSGLGLTPMYNVTPNPALNGQYNPGFAYDPAGPVYHNFRLRGGDLLLSGRLQLNRLFAPQGQENWDLYLGAGAGAQFYRSRTDAYDEAAGQLYPYDQVIGSRAADVRQALILMRDGTFETLAERDFVNATTFRGFIINSVFALTSGIRFQLGSQMGVGIEGRVLFPSDDLLDGLQWDATGQASPTNDRVLSVALTLDYVF